MSAPAWVADLCTVALLRNVVKPHTGILGTGEELEAGGGAAV